ncbi:MAG: UDP-4-amino-4,6-dideoxy-N-acetyl-beta-L-altrosamine N-acetyltransferase [candidate division Zixibacteria bacterium]|nr:UDP-4-amino-4,6-dideoxy-N-acetyl-beta-L-altrosamine N-acetyltransferase [candidate division Zixibacteria bacterium]
MEILFRQVTQKDLKVILKWRTMPEVSSYMYTDFKPSMDRQRKWLHAISNDESRRDWIICVDGEDVGLVSLVSINEVNKRCEWAYYLGSPNVRGKGIGRNVELNILEYVFDTLKLNKLCCEVFVSNEKVIAIHEKFGSRTEGKRREHIFKNGEFHDIVEMGILKNDWEREIKGKLEFVRAQFE